MDNCSAAGRYTPRRSLVYQHPLKSCHGSYISKECAKRWRHFLNPDLDHSRWESEDDTRLWVAVGKHGTNWRKVVEEEFPERSPTNVKNRCVFHSMNGLSCLTDLDPAMQ